MKQEGATLGIYPKGNRISNRQNREPLSNLLTSPTTALKMKQKGFAPETIQEVTGLATEKIEKL